MVLALQEVTAPCEGQWRDSANLEVQEDAEAVQQLRLRALELVSMARLLHVSPAAVRMNKSRVLSRLRLELGDVD